MHVSCVLSNYTPCTYVLHIFCYFYTHLFTNKNSSVSYLHTHTYHRYPNTHPFAGTQWADNICAFSTVRYQPQPLVIQGPGAGAAVTAAGVYADMIRIAKTL